MWSPVCGRSGSYVRGPLYSFSGFLVRLFSPHLSVVCGWPFATPPSGTSVGGLLGARCGVANKEVVAAVTRGDPL